MALEAIPPQGRRSSLFMLIINVPESRYSMSQADEIVFSYAINLSEWYRLQLFHSVYIGNIKIANLSRRNPNDLFAICYLCVHLQV